MIPFWIAMFLIGFFGTLIFFALFYIILKAIEKKKEKVKAEDEDSKGE